MVQKNQTCSSSTKVSGLDMKNKTKTMTTTPPSNTPNTAPKLQRCNRTTLRRDKKELPQRSLVLSQFVYDEVSRTNLGLVKQIYPYPNQGFYVVHTTLYWLLLNSEFMIVDSNKDFHGQGHTVSFVDPFICGN